MSTLVSKTPVWRVKWQLRNGDPGTFYYADIPVCTRSHIDWTVEGLKKNGSIIPETVEYALLVP